MAKRQGVMLAHPAEPKRISALGPECIVQPKVKGVRCRRRQVNPAIHENEFQLVSSSGAEKKFLDHIHHQLTRLPNLQYDGELYVHGMAESEINSRVSRTVNPHPDIGSIEFHIFDYISQLDMTSREQGLYLLENIVSALKLTHIKVVPTYRIKTEMWGSYLDTFMQMGYEGIILRGVYSKYETKRSPGLLKFKPRSSDIYQIVRVEQGTGWCHDRLGSFVVKGKDGNEFGVGTGPCLTAQGRYLLWHKRKELPGKYLLVKHEELKTVNDLPICVVAVQVLSDEELEVYKEAQHNDLTGE